MSDLCEWVGHYAKYETSWKDKNGDDWSINERIEMGGGDVYPSPDFDSGFVSVIETFFKLRGFLKGYDEPITPMLINSMGEYIPFAYRGIIFAMDKSYCGGMAWAAAYWEGK